MLSIKTYDNQKIQIVSDEVEIGDVEIFVGKTPTKDIHKLKLVGKFAKDAVIFDKPSQFPVYFLWNDENPRIVSFRQIPLEGTFNFRDLGGYIGAGGKQVKWGEFFRADALNNLTAADVAILEDLELKTIVDFRGESEWNAAPDVAIPSAKIINLSPNAAVAKLASGNIVDDKGKIDKLLEIAESPEGEAYFEKHLNAMAKQMRDLVSGDFEIGQYQQFMQLLLKEENMPMVFHCRGGKDRTGWGAMLILVALGVSQEQITEDYHLTKECMKERNVRRMNEYKKHTDNEIVLTYLAGLMDTRQAYLDAAFVAIEELAETSEGYLKEIMNLTDQDITILRDRYLE